MRVIAYLRVSTDEQAISGLGLVAQEMAIRTEAIRKGWEVVAVIADEGVSGKCLDRPGLHEALSRAASGEAEAVAVAKLDRATRSLVGVADLLEWTRKAGVGLVALDLGIDTTTSTGRLVAHVMASVAEWERETISQRTRAAVAVKRERGEKTGRPSVRQAAPEIASRIQQLRQSGSTWQAIADALNRDKVPTVRGGAEWRVSSVQAAAGYVRPAAPAKRGSLPDVPRRRRRA